ncbi:MAG: ribose 5-phosphate isomerase B [Planctomycetota bacterium]|jgi:ribose 5-phosphate isomerase B
MTLPNLDLAGIARRAASRALARGHSDDVPPEIRGAVQVDCGGDTDRPAEKGAAAPRRTDRPLVTTSCLSDTPDGGEFRVATDAQVTDAAQEEAHRRGISIRRKSIGAAPAGTGPLRIAVGSDHGGFGLKTMVMSWLAELGHRALDLGTHNTSSCDYPDFAHAVALAVADGNADLGVVIDGAGIGSAMTANKVPGVLAANAWCAAAARNAREHNHANVLTLGAGMIDAPTAESVLRAFIATPVGPGRHARRVDKIIALETRYSARHSAVHPY